MSSKIWLVKVDNLWLKMNEQWKNTVLYNLRDFLWAYVWGTPKPTYLKYSYNIMVLACFKTKKRMDKIVNKNIYEMMSQPQ